MPGELWKTEPSGVLSTETGGFRLIVQAPDQTGGLVRFLVLRQAMKGGVDALVGSGNETGVQAAMTAAEQMARRFRESGPRRGPTSP